MSTTDSGTIIQTRGLTKRYDRVVAVHDLDLDVYAGEVFGFLGPNGSGKTTTVKLLLGLIQPTSGDITLFGEPVESARPRLLRHIGAIVEAPAFYPYLSGRDNLRLLARLDGIGEERINAVLSQVSLQDAADRKFGSYSMGMKQRLGIAAALLRDPKLVLLDEPTSGLDPAGQREVRELIPRLARSGCTVFLSSHTMYEVQAICDRVGILKQGELLSSGPVKALLKQSDVTDIRVPDSSAAMRILEQLDWVNTVTTENGFVTVSAPIDRSSELNEALAKSGIYASEIRPREQSLEEFFLQVTGGESAD